jgi:hypothetical protein
MLAFFSRVDSVYQDMCKGEPDPGFMIRLAPTADFLRYYDRESESAKKWLYSLTLSDGIERWCIGGQNPRRGYELAQVLKEGRQDMPWVFKGLGGCLLGSQDTYKLLQTQGKGNYGDEIQKLTNEIKDVVHGQGNLKKILDGLEEIAKGNPVEKEGRFRAANPHLQEE